MAIGRPSKRPAILPLSGATPAKTKPTCPAWLDANAKKKWREVVKLMESLGILAAADGDALAMYCAAHGHYLAAEAKLAEQSEVIEGRKGLYRNPWVDISATAQKQLAVLGSRLGLTPQSRKKLGIPVAKQVAGIPARARKSERPPPADFGGA